MAIAFTRNTGVGITGSEQIGDLAIGLNAQDYTSNPGGKTWWYGPDESSKYVIATDFPTENKGTPVGNTGTVEFWGTGSGDNQLLGLINKIPERVSETAFTDLDTALAWLMGNGYWTNHPDFFPPAPRDCKISFRIQPLPHFNRAATAGGMMLYNPTLEEMYVGLNYYEDSYTTYVPGYLDVDNVALKSTIYISSSESPNQGYFVTSSTITDIPGSGNIWFDKNYQLLYTMGMVSKSAYGESHRVAKYDVSDKEVKAISPKIGPSPENYTVTWITGLSNLGLVYVSYSTGSSFNKDSKIESYYTSSLTLKDSYIFEATNYGSEGVGGMASNPNNNTILVLGADKDGNTLKTTLFNSDLSVISTNTYPNTPDGTPIGYDNIIYVPETDCFYIRTGRSNEPSGPKQKSDGLLIVVASNNTTKAVVDLGGGDGSSSVFNSGGLVFDPKRKVIWTSVFNYNRTGNLDQWFVKAIDIEGNKLVKTLPQPENLVTSGGEGISARNFGLDLKNDKLYIGDHTNNPYTEGNIMVWDLQDLWPV